MNLTIRPDCFVNGLIIEGNRAVGARVESGGELFEVHADEIVLSGGAIGSPHILLLSGIGPARNLESVGVPVVHDAPGVGRNLRDHPQVSVVWKTKDDYEFDPVAPHIQQVLRYTAEGSHLRNDMLIHALSAATREPHYLVTESVPFGIGMTCALYLAAGAGTPRACVAGPAHPPHARLQLPRGGVRPQPDARGRPDLPRPRPA